MFAEKWELSPVCLVSTVFSEQQSHFIWSIFPLFSPSLLSGSCVWWWVCCSIPSWLFTFTSLFLLCKNLTYFSLCTDYFVSCAEIKRTESTTWTLFQIITAVLSIILSRTHFISLSFVPLYPQCIVQPVNPQEAGCICFIPNLSCFRVLTLFLTAGHLQVFNLLSSSLIRFTAVALGRTVDIQQRSERVNIVWLS